MKLSHPHPLGAIDVTALLEVLCYHDLSVYTIEISQLQESGLDLLFY